MNHRTEERGYWNATAPAPEFPRLERSARVDIAIIGAGIVGITAARALKDMGLTVALIEARRVGRQATGTSTAKITSQHNLVYRHLLTHFDEGLVRLYADAQQSALATIRTLVERHGIACDLETRAAYTYTRDERHVAALEDEARLARRLGLPAALVRETGLPFDVAAALRYDDQAQFHPTKYVAGLARTIPGAGCHVFEHSRAIDWQPTRVVTRDGTVSAGHVIMATQIPLGHTGAYYARAYPQAEAVIAARVPGAADGMYVSVEQPRRSLRTHVGEDGAVYAVAAGAPFKPGHADDERRSFADLERWLRGHFAAEPVAYRWVNEDYVSMDGAPFVGWSSPRDGYLVATGFGAWGITNGTAAGVLLADLAAGRPNPWLQMFDARRVKPLAGGARFVQKNAEAAAELVGGYLARRARSIDDLSPGAAATMKIDGRHVAVFKDENGAIHGVSAVCSHLGCIVGWNATERSWDCPCHGSRFAVDGEVLHGPATAPLATVTCT